MSRKLNEIKKLKTHLYHYRSEEIVPAGSGGPGLARVASGADSEGEGDIHIPDTCSERSVRKDSGGKIAD